LSLSAFYCFRSFTFCFFINATATTKIYTLSLHDALPIFQVAVPPIEPLPWLIQSLARGVVRRGEPREILRAVGPERGRRGALRRDRKSTRLNSSHVAISYAVFCLKKKNKMNNKCRLPQVN